MIRRNDNETLEIVKRTIRATFPDVTISVLDNPNDYASGILYISNVPADFGAAFSKELDFVTVPVEAGSERGVMVIPMPEQEPEPTEAAQPYD